MSDMTTLSEPGQDSRSRPTMRNVAALAGVALKTVSRVVNGESGVSPELVARVNRAVAQLDYRPNMAASSLRRSDGKSAAIGLLLEDLANPYSSAVHRAIEDVARGRRVAVFAGSLDEDAERERALAETFLARRVDGLIVVPASTDHSYLLFDRRAGTPMVFVDRPPAHLDADAVLAANREGAIAGVAHLLARGHRRIAYLGDLATIHTASERYAGYVAALDRAGVEIDPRIVRWNLHDEETAAAATDDLLRLADPPTAIFSAQNLVTLGAIRSLRRLGRRFDVALVGFDDFPLADLLDPGVTVVAQDPAAIGTLAATILFRRLDGDRSATERHLVPTRLIERGSGEIPPPD